MTENSSQQNTGAEREQLDSTGEFFIVGAPLHAVRAGYVRRKADDQLYDVIVAGRYAHVLAPDNSGKSSLIAATAARLESNGRKIAILDLAQIGLRDGGMDPGRWYYNIAYRLLRQLRIRYDLQAWWQDKSMLSNRQRLVEFYSEVILQFVPEQVVIFVDEIQCVTDLPFDDQLLASIRAAHNARTTDPDFSRLTFALLGECDAEKLTKDKELSPFAVTESVSLDDFSREDIALFATELNLEADLARAALDRIFHWTNGQPYMVQKSARAIARANIDGDDAAQFDRIILQQLSGRAAVNNEPHMNHIHQAIVGDDQQREPVLNLYGKIRKGVDVPVDLGSPLQRKLMALGLLTIDGDGALRVRNRLYESVFTARWANENLSIGWRVPVAVAGLLLVLTMIPLWYTQWLPRPYIDVLTSPTVDLVTANNAYSNLRSFPGHAETADGLYRRFLSQRALAAATESEITVIAEEALALPEAEPFADNLVADYWDRRAMDAMRSEDRDAALIATLQSLVAPTTRRRQRAARLIADDYPMLLASLPGPRSPRTVFDPAGMLLTAVAGENVSQWSYSKRALGRRDDWVMTALEVNPLVRRVVVDRQGVVQRTGLTLKISHARLSDLRIKVIAPSGRTVEVETGVERASFSDEIRIAPAQLRDLVGESLQGTWSLSLRDESPGVAGQLVGWNLRINSQGIVEDFQRGLNIPEPNVRETDDVWFDAGGRYAIARATQSDSARIWDLAFAEPVRAIAVSESEALVGLDPGARRLVTASQDRVNVWDTASGDRISSIPLGAASDDVKLTGDGQSLFVELRSDEETRLEVWSLEERELTAEVTVAGVPSLVAVDSTGTRIAAADYDRAIRIWDIATGDLLGQIDLPMQPSAIQLAPGGNTLGVIYGNMGVSLWSIGEPMRALREETGDGQWQLTFAPSGSSVLIGYPDSGFQMYACDNGLPVGPILGLHDDSYASGLLAYSDDEQFLLTGAREGMLRFWKAAIPTASGSSARGDEHQPWNPSGDNPVVALPGGTRVAVGDVAGHVHIVPAGAIAAALDEIASDVSFVGHTVPVRLLATNEAGTLIASVATDNTLRVWSADSGQPLPYVAQIDGTPVSRVAFSTDSSVLAVLNSSNVRLIDAASGENVADFVLDAPHKTFAFAANNALYLGDVNGSLRLLERDMDGAWRMRQIWQGESGISWLEASPRGEYLIVVDATHRASQFVLNDGTISPDTLTLAGDVQDVAFNGSRVMFRTARWVHRASVSVTGLVALDSVLVPKVLNGGRMVNGLSGDGRTVANRTYLPVARDGAAELHELGFEGHAGPTLFGNKDELLNEWRQKLNGAPETTAPVDPR